MIKLVATQTHPEHEAGTHYEVMPIFAARDLWKKWATPEADEPTGNYQHRDLQDAPDEEDRPKRRYRRRDMQAEK